MSRDTNGKMVKNVKVKNYLFFILIINNEAIFDLTVTLKAPAILIEAEMGVFDTGQSRLSGV